MSVRIKKPELVIAIFYTFRFALKMIVGNDGNYDLMYLLAIYAILCIFFYQNRKFISNFRWVLLLCVMWVSADIGGPIAINSTKAIVYITKMTLCIYLFMFVREKIEYFDLQIFINYSVFFLAVQTILALLQRNSAWFWRLAENRMELLFLEPSELGVFIGILILLQVFLMKENGELKEHIGNVVVLSGILILSSSMSGILYTLFTSIIYLAFDNESKKEGISKKQLLFLFIAVLGVALMLSSDNYISNRFFNALNGTDSSFNTRSSVPIQTLVEYYKKYGFFGFGFGNMNTVRGMQFFNLKAKNYVICAAYFLFAIEGGIVAIIAEVIFTLKLLKECLKSGSAFHLALFIFVFFYMYLGGYTTNPVVWILYAIMYTEKEKLLRTNE